MMALCALWGAAAMSASVMAMDARSEAAVKAAFVLRFASYVEWPPHTVPPRSFNIAVLGDSDVALSLQNLAKGRTVMGRPIQVRRIVNVETAGNIQLLYVGADRRGDLRAQLAALDERSVLVVASEDGALDSGSTINLVLAEQRVRFEVSLEAARLAGLKISSELLSLAVRVQK
jgi:hypothetical protein